MSTNQNFSYKDLMSKLIQRMLVKSQGRFLLYPHKETGLG